MITNVSKIFPCDCMSEGVIVTVEKDKDFFDCKGAPFIGLSFWELHKKFDKGYSLSLWERIRLAYRILKKGSPYLDMIWMRKSIAKQLANYILKLLREK